MQTIRDKYNRYQRARAWDSCLTNKLVESVCPMPTSFKVGNSGQPIAKMVMPSPELISRLKVRKGTYKAMATNSGEYAPIAFQPSLHNEAIAVGCRVLKQTPPPDNLVVQDFVSWVKRNFDMLFPDWHKVTPVPFEQYIENSNASPSVKNILKKTKEQLVSDGVDTNMVSDNLAYRWTTRSSFVKVENQLYQSPTTTNRADAPYLTVLGKENLDQHKPKAPRLIQGAQPEFICITGPFFMALQMQVKRMWNRDFAIYFTSGATASQISKYITKPMGQILEDDIGAFDSSVHYELCKLELWMTKKFGASPLICQLFDKNNRTHGKTHHGIKYKVLGTRKSGDPFTSVYNSILNGLMHMWAYCKLRDPGAINGYSLRSALSEVRMLVQGDDNALRHPGERLDFGWLLKLLGFDCEAVYRDSFYDLEFCSNIMYGTDRGFLFGPKVGRVLAKFGYIINPPANIHPYQILKGIALGFEQSSTYIPLLKALCDRVLTITRSWQAVQLKEFKPKLKYCEAKENDYGYSFTNRYDLSYPAIKELVSVLQISPLCSYGKTNLLSLHPHFTLLLDRDTDAVKDIFVSHN